MNIKLAQETKVLVIDNQVLAKGYLKYTMEDLGFQNISYVDQSGDAIDAIKVNHFDLILCAYDLKEEREGYFLYDKIKSDNLLSLTTAFVFVSAETAADVVHSIIELQPDEFVAKPFTTADLGKRLTRVLRRKQAFFYFI